MEFYAGTARYDRPPARKLQAPQTRMVNSALWGNPPMHYLADIKPAPPDPYGKFVWVSDIKAATKFSSLAEAEAAKRTMLDATGIIDSWFVVKE